MALVLHSFLSFRLNENFTLIRSPEPNEKFTFAEDQRKSSVCEQTSKSNEVVSCDIEALQKSCASRTPAERRLSALQKSSSDTSLATQERHLSLEAARYSCLELQPVCLFSEGDVSKRDSWPSVKDSSIVWASSYVDCFDRPHDSSVTCSRALSSDCIGKISSVDRKRMNSVNGSKMKNGPVVQKAVSGVPAMHAACCKVILQR